MEDGGTRDAFGADVFFAFGEDVGEVLVEDDYGDEEDWCFAEGEGGTK